MIEFEVKKPLRIKFTFNKKRLMTLIGVKAKNHFVEGFRRGGYMTDNSKNGWKPRKRPYHYEKRGNSWRKISDTGRAILVQSGTLRRSIQVLWIKKNAVSIGTKGIVYAAIHNFGLKGRAFGKYPFRMPQREFIGRSKELENQIKTLIQKQIKIDKK